MTATAPMQPTPQPAPRAEWYGDGWGHMSIATAEALFPTQVARIRFKFRDGNMFKVHGYTDVNHFHCFVLWRDSGHGFMYLTGKKYHSGTAWCWTTLIKVIQP